MIFPNKIFSGYHGRCHCQGIAVDQNKGYIYYSFTTMLVKSDLDGNIIGTVEGLIGHLGCIDLCRRDGRVYGSLEYKNDSIGKGILETLELSSAKNINAFYCAIFDVDKIDSIGMNAESDGIMRAVYLPEVVEDYEGTATIGGNDLKHKYACSGIDGLDFGPMWGTSKGKEYLRICYGVYGDIDRIDNDYQIIMTFDADTWWDTAAVPLKQGEPVLNSERSLSRCFVYTGATNWGIQNLEYDAYKKRWIISVYNGEKPCFPNYDMFFISADAKPFLTNHKVYGEEILELPLMNEGNYFPYGETGIYAFGDGRYYFSQHGEDVELGQYSNVVLYRHTDDDMNPFKEI